VNGNEPTSANGLSPRIQNGVRIGTNPEHTVSTMRTATTLMLKLIALGCLEATRRLESPTTRAANR